MVSCSCPPPSKLFKLSLTLSQSQACANICSVFSLPLKCTASDLLVQLQTPPHSLYIAVTHLRTIRQTAQQR